MKQSRPLLAILQEDNPKIKSIVDSKQTDQLVNYLITIMNIKVSSEIEKKDLQIQMLVVMDFIKSKFGNLTIPEIQEAFKMYVAREFPQIKVFRILDCVSVGEVLDAYKSFRNESLRIYSQKKTELLNAPKQVTDQDRAAIRESFLKTVFDELKEHKYFPDAWLLFDELEASGIIKISNQDKEFQYKTEQLRYLRTLEEDYAKRPHSTIAKADLNTARETIRQGKRLNIVKNKCRSIAVSEYLNRFTDDYDSFLEVFKR